MIRKILRLRKRHQLSILAVYKLLKTYGGSYTKASNSLKYKIMV
jgi:hypothetical protein